MTAPIAGGQVNPSLLSDQSLDTVGKEIYEGSLSNSLDFCKTMVTISTGALGLYYALAGFILPEKFRPSGEIDASSWDWLPFVDPVMSAVSFAMIPPALFLAATIVFAIGYLPLLSKIDLNKLRGQGGARGWWADRYAVENVRTVLVLKRSIAGYLGILLFALGVAAMGVVVHDIAVQAEDKAKTEEAEDKSQYAVVLSDDGSLVCGELLTDETSGVLAIGQSGNLVEGASDFQLVDKCPTSTS